MADPRPFAIGSNPPLIPDEGRVAGKGRHAELLRTCDVYRDICLAQLGKVEIDG